VGQVIILDARQMPEPKSEHLIVILVLAIAVVSGALLEKYIVNQRFDKQMNEWGFYSYQLNEKTGEIDRLFNPRTIVLDDLKLESFKHRLNYGDK
jgi:hypothetical protein